MSSGKTPRFRLSSDSDLRPEAWEATIWERDPNQGYYPENDLRPDLTIYHLGRDNYQGYHQEASIEAAIWKEDAIEAAIEARIEAAFQEGAEIKTATEVAIKSIILRQAAIKATLGGYNGSCHLARGQGRGRHRTLDLRLSSSIPVCHWF